MFRIGVLAFFLGGCAAEFSTSGVPPEERALSSNGGSLDSSTAAGVTKACAERTQQRLSAPISFPRPMQACPWGNGDNMGPVNEHFQARLEQRSGFALPQGAVICDIQFNFRNTPFRYDDHFVLSFNGLILASSADFQTVLPSADNFLLYDWGGIRGLAWQSVPQTGFCAGSNRGLATCQIPQTDTPGSLVLQYQPQLIHELSARTTGAPEHVFRFVTIGDNDQTVDCNHEPLDFDVDVFYVR